MSALGEHIRCRLRNDGPIAATPERRRVVARIILEKGRDFDLLAFGLADTHLHLAKGEAGAGGELARRVEIAITRRFGLEVGFERVRIEAVVDIWHLYRVFEYVLRQDRRHKIETDPLREATNLPDLLGLRGIGGYTAGNVRRLLPRVTRGQLLELLGAPKLAPADGPVERIVQSAAAAICRPQLIGYSHEVQAARRAVIAIAEDRLGSPRLAALLDVHRATVNRLRKMPPDGVLVERTRFQLGLFQARWEAAVGVEEIGSPPQRRAA
jgi:hypothetical protein